MDFLTYFQSISFFQIFQFILMFLFNLFYFIYKSKNAEVWINKENNWALLYKITSFKVYKSSDLLNNITIEIKIIFQF